MIGARMSTSLTRRDFLRSAGGVTFLALAPIGDGLFAARATASDNTLPLFTVVPYIQPGSNSLLRDDEESMIIAWQTHPEPADFSVEFGGTTTYGRVANVSQIARPSGRDDRDLRHNWHAELTGLRLGQQYHYRVRGNGQTLAEGFFATRQPRGRKIRFVAFGDNSFGDISDRAIAYYAYQQHPDFVMNCGDNVYTYGSDDEYQRFFFPVYNTDLAGPREGAPLLRSVPFYTVMANHDVHDTDADGHEVADFGKHAGALAYYTAMHLPLNGPEAPTHLTPTTGPDARLEAFRASAGARFPRMANYSFDYGDAHFLCLDSNIYIDPNDPALQAWIVEDLSHTDAIWKFVVFHHPAFNVGDEHYQEQHMRVLSPLFEAQRVDIVLNGHEHNYQRMRPFRFAPNGVGKSAAAKQLDRRVPGTFTMDRVFDGVHHTRPDGILHIISGGGGRELHDPGYTDNPERWRRADDGHVDYVAKMVSDRHSLSVFDIDSTRLTMAQIDETGREIDRITVTKR
jgi:acid phosphatase type 7